MKEEIKFHKLDTNIIYKYASACYIVQKMALLMACVNALTLLKIKMANQAKNLKNNEIQGNTSLK